jgi:hypothetical protein
VSAHIPKGYANPEKVLFLDFDGVLHLESECDSSPFDRLHLLEELAAESDFCVVVSSSWRFRYSQSQLQEFLGPELKVIGVTGEAVIGRHARAQEIMSYAQLKRINNWKALDDARFEFPENFSNLIWCDPRTGLTRDHLEPLKAWLNSPD